MTLTDLVTGVLARWRDVGRVTIAVAAFALALALVLPPSYSSRTSFVTADAGISLPQGLADLAGQSGVSGLASQLGLGGGSDPSTTPAFYAQLLTSRELLTRLVLSRYPDPRSGTLGDSADLLGIFRIKAKDRERAIEIAVKRMRTSLVIGFDARTAMVGIEARSRWAPLSAAIANRAEELVSAFNREQRLSRASARRRFLEGRVAEAQGELRAAEAALRGFYQQNRLWQSSPGLLVDERRARRQVESSSDLYLTLRREFEAARIDEVNTTPVITAVDRAVPPRRPVWPQPVPIAITALLLGAGLGLLWAATRVLAGHWAAQHPSEAGALREAVRRLFRELGQAARLPFLASARRRAASRPP